MTTTRPTVAAECQRRGNCRAGLRGLRMRHLPSGREILCRGSEWGPETRLLILVDDGYRPTRADVVRRMAARLGEGTPAYRDAVEAYDVLGLICLADVPMGKPAERLDARECVLLGRWRVTCCRPRRKRSAALSAS